ncbi:MAG: cold shock domain-containing protein [Candidatus Diapherotrites archaeon]|nr:cold shock domain-containing protein [Candidatus Diapherotrites archaeon]
MNGKVKWYNETKGYGFISGEDGVDYFVHMNSLKPGMKLKENDAVSFEPVKTEKGQQAQDVNLL